MLWADDDSNLPKNYFSALAQLKSLERRLEKDRNMKDNYLKTIQEHFSKGYSVQVEQSDCFTAESSCEWYLSHRSVLHRQKPGK